MLSFREIGWNFRHSPKLAEWMRRGVFRGLRNRLRHPFRLIPAQSPVIGKFFVFSSGAGSARACIPSGVLGGDGALVPPPLVPGWGGGHWRVVLPDSGPPCAGPLPLFFPCPPAAPVPLSNPLFLPPPFFFSSLPFPPPGCPPPPRNSNPLLQPPPLSKGGEGRGSPAARVSSRRRHCCGGGGGWRLVLPASGPSCTLPLDKK